MDLQALKRLEVPTGIVDAVLDTDTYNEIDDQFALSYMLRSTERIRVKAVYAAPFLNANSESPEDGMRKSYDEIQTVLRLAGRSDLQSETRLGSVRYLASETEYVDSDAARDLCLRAMAYSPENPLYVVSIGCITNIASALLMKPEIRDRIVIVWLGGHSLEWPDTAEFNMMQDIAAARVVFSSGAAIVQLPCAGVADHFAISEPELRYWLLGKNALCDHLAGATIEAANQYAAGKPWSRVIWDVTAVAWLNNDRSRFMESRLIPSPICQYDRRYSFDPRRPLYRYVWQIHRDALMTDLIQKLTRKEDAQK